MGRDYAGLILENTDKGLVLSHVECLRADKVKPDEVRASVPLSQNTDVYKRQNLFSFLLRTFSCAYPA